MADGKTISRETLKKFVTRTVRDLWLRAPRYGFHDTRYYVPTFAELRSIYGQITFPPYEPDTFDCEDFSYLCKGMFAAKVRQDGSFDAPWVLGLAFGRFQWMGGGQIDHVCNWSVAPDRTFAWLEPQSGDLFPIGACTGGLRLLLA